MLAGAAVGVAADVLHTRHLLGLHTAVLSANIILSS